VWSEEVGDIEAKPTKKSSCGACVLEAGKSYADTDDMEIGLPKQEEQSSDKLVKEKVMEFLTQDLTLNLLCRTTFYTYMAALLRKETGEYTFDEM